MKGLISARAHAERVLSLHDSVLKCIKSDRKILYMGAENVYIYVSKLKSHEGCYIFIKNKHVYKCDIDFIQQSNKQWVNIKRRTF